MSQDMRDESGQRYTNAKRIDLRKIDFRQVSSHWDECPQADDPSSGSYDLEFLSQPESSSPQSSTQRSSGQGIVNLKCTRCNKEWAIDNLFVRDNENKQQDEQPEEKPSSAPIVWCLQESDTGLQYEKAKAINVQKIDVKRLSRHWNKKCKQTNDPCCSSADFEFLSKPWSSEQESSLLSSSGRDITYLRCTRCNKEWAMDALHMQETEQSSYSPSIFWCLHTEKWYENTKRIKVREIDFRQVLDHWDNECPQVNQPCRGSDFEFLSKPRSSEPDSSEQGSSGQDIVYSVHLKCKQCSREWAIEDLQVQQIEQPSCCASTCCNWCLQESDTGEYIPWKKVKDVLHPGDHVTWLRPVGYWHHGIVDCVNDDGSLEVWEWNVNGIGRSNKKECDVTGNCCWSPMYKSYYTDDMERENPPMLALLRAKYREGERGYSLCKENCEHMATYSKTGASQCNQIRQFSLSLVGWLLRLLLKLVLFGLVVILSEVIEVATKPSKEVIGIITLIVFELLYVVLCVVRIYYEAKRVMTCCIYPSVKVFLQTSLALGLSILCGVCLGNEVQKRLNLNESGTDRWKVAGFEIWFGILGGVIGNPVGFWLFSWLPWPYWCSWKETLGKTKATEARPDRDEQEMAQGTTSV